MLSLAMLLLSAQLAASDAPYRETRLTYRNTVSALSFAPGADLTYNPYFAVTMAMKLAWWFDDVWFVRGAVDLTRELTWPDDTTYANEIWVSDTVLNAGASGFWTIPWVEIGLSADVEVTLPTSKASSAETLMLATGVNLGLDREFKVAEGLAVSYTFTPTKYWHRYTTSEIATPLIPDCARSPAGCAGFLSTGSRNVDVALANDLTVDLTPVKWLVLSASIGTITGLLYPLAPSPVELSYQTGPDTPVRFLNYYTLTAILKPMPAIAILVGTDTINPQLRPDSSYESFLFNRYTTLFASLRLDFAGLMQQLHAGDRG